MRKPIGSFVALDRRVFLLLAVVLSLMVFSYENLNISAQENQTDLGSGTKRDNGGEPATPSSPQAGTLIISEFRLRGANGASDEFIEIYNPAGTSHTVTSTSGTGYGVAASDGVLRCTIPNGTVIPGYGHFLCTNSVGYSYSSYPAGNGTTSTGDATYATDIPDNVGIAVFNTNIPANFSIANRFDAVGSSAEANTLYKEGTGYPPIEGNNIDCSFTRLSTGLTVTNPPFAGTPITGLPQNTGNNAADFIFVDTNGTSEGAGQRLGAPGPKNLSSPIFSNNPTISRSSLDVCAAPGSAPNKVRDNTSDPSNNSTFGTIDVRRTFTNNTGASITRLRVRFLNIATFPSASGIADLRPRTSSDLVVTVDRPPCNFGTSNINVRGTTLEQDNTAPSTGQPNGGGFNSSMGVGAITLGTPLANGASIDLRFLFGIQQTGSYNIAAIVESLPAAGNLWILHGNTEVPSDSETAVINRTPFDFDGDRKTDISIFRPSDGSWWLQRSTAGLGVFPFGSSTDIMAPGDFTGDGAADIAFFRPSTGQWFVLRSEDAAFFAFPFGTNGDIPVPADYDGDGKTDAAVFRPSTHTWFIQNSGGGTTITTFGATGDQPIAADFDGDGKADIGVFRPSGATPGAAEWWVQRSSTGLMAFQFGTSTDKAVPGDYTGDGKADCAFWRPSTGQWFVLRSEDFNFFAFPFGQAGDIPAPGDYDGDGRFDAAVFRPSNATWFVNRTTAGLLIQTFGASTDKPVPNAFVRN